MLAIDITLVMPYFRGKRYPHLHRYGYLGATFGEIVLTLVTQPWRWLPVMFAPAKLFYLLAMLSDPVPPPDAVPVVCAAVPRARRDRRLPPAPASVKA